MNTVWYIYAESGQVGPYSADDIRSFRAQGQVTDETYLWREGQAEWQALASIAEFAPPPPVAPPPAAPPPIAAPPAQSAPAGASKAAATVVAATTPVAKRKGPSKVFIIVTILFVMIAGLIYGLTQFAPDLILPLIGMEPPPAPVLIQRPAPPPMSQDEKDIRSLFETYSAAITAGDTKSLKRLLTGERAAMLTETGAVEMLAMVQAMRPAGIKIEKVDIVGEEATLLLKADGGVTGAARAILVDGTWLLLEESWNITMSDEAVDTGAIAPGDTGIMPAGE